MQILNLISFLRYSFPSKKLTLFLLYVYIDCRMWDCCTLYRRDFFFRACLVLCRPPPSNSLGVNCSNRSRLRASNEFCATFVHLSQVQAWYHSEHFTYAIHIVFFGIKSLRYVLDQTFIGVNSWLIVWLLVYRNLPELLWATLYCLDVLHSCTYKNIFRCNNESQFSEPADQNTTDL